MGKSVGIVTTARITHATPAAVLRQDGNRDWENDSFIPEGCDQTDIAAQLIDPMKAGGRLRDGRRPATLPARG